MGPLHFSENIYNIDEKASPDSQSFLLQKCGEGTRKLKETFGTYFAWFMFELICAVKQDIPSESDASFPAEI